MSKKTHVRFLKLRISFEKKSKIIFSLLQKVTIIWSHKHHIFKKSIIIFLNTGIDPRLLLSSLITQIDEIHAIQMQQYGFLASEVPNILNQTNSNGVNVGKNHINYQNLNININLIKKQNI